MIIIKAITADEMISATIMHMTAISQVVNSEPDDPGTTTEIM